MVPNAGRVRENGGEYHPHHFEYANSKHPHIDFFKSHFRDVRCLLLDSLSPHLPSTHLFYWSLSVPGSSWTNDDPYVPTFYEYFHSRCVRQIVWS